MNKVGLVTFYDDNFGTCLQAFALQYVIESLGYDVSIVKYHRGNQAIVKENRMAKIVKYSPKTVINYLINYKFIQQRKKGFDDFRNKYLHFDSTYNLYRDSDISVLKGKFNALVCGSDMMWSTQFKADWPYYLLNFENKSKTISYSPSFGHNCMSDEEKEMFLPLINNIGHLSCREQDGVRFIKDSFGLEATHAIDPTCLHTKEVWNKIIGNNERLCADDYVLTYSFLGTKKNGRNKIFSQFKEGKYGRLVILSGAEDEYKKYRYNGYASPIEFIRLYRDCRFVITDTFHGMLFAIIFEKPFIVLDKSSFGVTADRLVSTLKTLGLENRYVKANAVIDERYLTLDYTKPNEILSKQRIASIEYLRNSLKDVVGK